jgi:hypothetical protein
MDAKITFPGLAALASALEKIAAQMPFPDDWRTDHPLQGETFTGLERALGDVSNSIDNAGEAVADAIRYGFEVLADAHDGGGRAKARADAAHAQQEAQAAEFSKAAAAQAEHDFG